MELEYRNNTSGLIAVTVVGGGGTGSYLIEDLINFLNGLNRDYKIKVVDGDVLEDKNLLRQGFYKDDIGLCKSDALTNRYKDKVNHKGDIESYTEFIRDAVYFKDLWMIERDNIADYIVISCVDNLYARLRMTLAQHLSHHWFKAKGLDVNNIYIDSGNTEFFGQTLKSVISKDDNSLLGDFADRLIDKKPYKRALNSLLKQDKLLGDNNQLNSTFSIKEDWQNNLTKADHEMSCDVMAESSPQNILVNQFSSLGILMQLNSVFKGEINPNNAIYYFDSKELTMFNSEYKNLLRDYPTFLRELLEFINTDEGKEVFDL